MAGRAAPEAEKSPSATKLTHEMQLAIADAKRVLEAAQQRDKRYADMKRKDISFKVGDYVLLSTKNLNLKAAMGDEGGRRKLMPRFIGPFTVEAVINPVTYSLHLPAHLGCHPVFHVSLLRPFKPDAKRPPMPVPTMVDGQAEWEVDHLVEHRMRATGKGRPRKVEYLVRWKGFNENFDTWEPASSLVNAPKVVDAYWKRIGQKPPDGAKVKK